MKSSRPWVRAAWAKCIGRAIRAWRDVAVKALPACAAHDPERIGRFEREAQILAGLSHPHIAALYGLEESGLPAPPTARSSSSWSSSKGAHCPID